MHPLFDKSVRDALEGLTPDMSGLRVSKKLRQSLPPEIARLAASLHHLRIRSSKRFSTLQLPFLNEKGFMQASAEMVARWRAERIAAQRRGATIYDATCGIGADTCALALAGMRVVYGDLSQENLQFARANLDANDVGALGVRTDATSGSVRSELILIDPDRRSGGERSMDPQSWSPDLASALRVASQHEGACLKLAPALSAELLQAYEDANLPEALPRQREWLSHRGELAELCLWTGSLAGCEVLAGCEDLAGGEDLAGCDSPADGDNKTGIDDLARGEEIAVGDTMKRHATRLDEGGVQSIAGFPMRVAPLDLERARAARWIGDPDPALLRSGLLGNLAKEFGLAPLAGPIAYLGGDHEPRTPFLRVWKVLASTSLDPKKVRAMLNERDIGPIHVRKRGHGDSPQVLEKRLRGRGSRRGELLIARLEKGHWAYLVEAQSPPRDTGSGAELVGDEGFEPPTSSL